MPFKDGFEQGFGRVDLVHTTGVILDGPRQLVSQSRSNFGNYLTEDCSSLAGWTLHTTGTAGITQLTIGEGGTANPAGSAAFQFSTGATINSYCALNRTLANLPASYGVGQLLALPNVNENPANAFQLAIQNTVDGRVLNLLFSANHISVLDYNGDAHLLSHHSPTYVCENWIENKANGDGTNTVSLLQGTEFIASVAVTMQTQSNPGMVYMQQRNTANAAQGSQLLALWLGDTQYPDAGLLQGAPWSVPFDAQAVNFQFEVEDVCNDVVMGTDFTAALIHNGTEVAMTLVDLGTVGRGIIDFTKPVRLFGATPARTIAQNDTLAYKCHMLNGKFMAVVGVTMQPVTVY